MKKVTAVGLDLAKSVFQVHGADEDGRAVLRKALKRGQVAEFFAQLPPCTVGMEACGSAHHWARKLRELGHEVRLIAPQYVKPFVKRNKTDAADAEAICEAMGRPGMRFVPVKTTEQQSILSVHRVRQGFVRARTAMANQVRGLLAEFGIVVARGIENIPRLRSAMMDQALPGTFRQLVDIQLHHLGEIQDRIDELDRQIARWHRESYRLSGS
ncbi:Transposase [Solimonas aquatica]|uniref:Transposase n=1 Tax=Solimonas aquatica TaxID=489703 RepID=A0A1H9AA62_9GAMM|nr:Transposase [Solimonas aquatica]